MNQWKEHLKRLMTSSEDRVPGEITKNLRDIGADMGDDGAEALLDEVQIVVRAPCTLVRLQLTIEHSLDLWLENARMRTKMRNMNQEYHLRRRANSV